MAITDDTKLVEIDDENEILEALVILGGSALMRGNRRLYEHICRAEIQYKEGINLHLTDNLGFLEGR